MHCFTCSTSFHVWSISHLFTVHLSGGISVSNARPPSVEPRNHLEMVLPASLQGVTQHHMDFVMN